MEHSLRGWGGRKPARQDRLQRRVHFNPQCSRGSIQRPSGQSQDVIPASRLWFWAPWGRQDTWSGGFCTVWAEKQLLRHNLAKPGSGDTTPGPDSEPGGEMRSPYLGKCFWPEHLGTQLPKGKSQWLMMKGVGGSVAMSLSTCVELAVLKGHKVHPPRPATGWPRGLGYNQMADSWLEDKLPV